MTEREKIVRWLRRVAPTLIRDQEAALVMAADNIEAGAHLRRLEPTIPASEWIKKSNPFIPYTHANEERAIQPKRESFNRNVKRTRERWLTKRLRVTSGLACRQDARCLHGRRNGIIRRGAG